MLLEIIRNYEYSLLNIHEIYMHVSKRDFKPLVEFIIMLSHNVLFCFFLLIKLYYAHCGDLDIMTYV